jgi:uncharacterized protein (DUF2267 family)
MKYERLLSVVEHEAQVDRQTAENALRATLQTLAQRISPGQVRDMAEQLPEQLAQWMRPAETIEPFHSDEFLRRVARREGVDTETAGKHVRAVFFAMSRAVTADEFDDMLSELPKDYEPLIGRGRRPPDAVMPCEEFLSRVADRADTDIETAKKAAEAVLETLAERIAGGEVRDLMQELPAELVPALKRGKDRTHGIATAMDLDEFLAEVAEREGVPVDEAREHARAVISTIRDAVVEKEFDDLVAELPRVYVSELAHP